MRRDDATIRHRAGTVLAVAAGAAAVWTAIVLLSGGVSVGAGAWQIASRDPVRPLAAALACGVLAIVMLGPAGSRRLARTLAGDRATIPARVAIAAALCAMVVAVAWNTRAVGGSDSSCYVLQAEAFAQGRVTLRPPLSDRPAFLSAAALAPIGFVPAATPPHEAVPICAPGLALVMAPALLFGRDAVFLVVPCFAALAVWCTFLLGRALGDGVSGAWAAVLLACSPILLYQAVQPMSDVPAAALWLAALVALRPPTDGAATAGARRELFAGFCASMAVLMRPNVALIVLPLLALLRGLRGWIRFGAGSAPAALAMIVLNAVRYGSPLASGYGDTDVLFSVAHVVPNLSRYPRWLLDTHTPLIALAAIAPVLAWPAPSRRVVLVATASAALTIATYLAYTVFDDWWYLRFLLPALPVLLVFAVAVVRRAVAALRCRPVVRHAVLAAIVLAASAWFLQAARARSVFDLARLESRFRGTGVYAAGGLPGNAAVLAVQQSGSIRYYGGRPTVMWDAVPEQALDQVVSALGDRGHVPVIAVEDGEDAAFRARFRSQQYGRLDWPPMAEVHGPVRVRVFDPRMRAAFLAGGRVETEHVWPGRSVR
jgi:hypothetical protein